MNATVTVTGIQNTPRGPENFSSDVSVSGRGGTVFGVRPVISSIGSRDAGTADPNKIHLDAGGVSMFPIDIKYTVDPPDYKSMPTGWVANLLMDGRLINYAAGDSRIKQGTATLPRSQVFEPRKHNYEAQLHSTLTYGKLESEKFRLPLRQKLLAGVSAAGASRYVDVVNKRVCDVRGSRLSRSPRTRSPRSPTSAWARAASCWATRWT
ncbi:hypothetical protein PEC18_36200 [Paucibacter sp. O1-1]|nr:hypothetical protein [Paucibacter sp. O1-1]MDA3831096.1 hypothetical protein [Paucibacter sp. O1-1]